MKRNTIWLATCVLWLLAACNNDKKEIAQAAQGYLNATGNYLIEDAMPYANKETREKTLPFLRDKLIPMTPQEYLDSNTPATIELGEIVQVGDTAVVFYTKTTPIKRLESEILVVKEDGQWLVFVPLEIPERISTDGKNATATISAANSLEQ